MLNENKYRDYDERAFICDPHFQDWALGRNPGNNAFWTDFVANHPEKKEVTDAARSFLQNVQFKEHLPEESLIEHSFARHQVEIDRLRNNKVVDIKRSVFTPGFLRIAAAIGGVLLIVAALLLSGDEHQTILVHTDFGNVKSILLPDSSSVVLNGNSNLKYDENWSKNNTREVWLQGEAFFDIRHINTDASQVKTFERFIVHTNDLTVEVLGTEFNIRQRRGKTEVVLQSGKIKVSFTNGKKDAIALNPGDRLSYNAENDQLVKGTTAAENASAWKEKKLLLDDPTAAEVAEYLEDVFGKKIVFANTNLANRKLEGPIQLTNLDDALFVLSTVLNAEIIKKDSTIMIRSR